MERQLISTINSIDIYAVKDENANFFVPVKTICEAIGIDHSAQVQRIKRHYILDSTVVTLTTVGADGKDREMLCLPLEFVYGWLFTIDANLVSESNRENVARYQRECYDILYRYFAGKAKRAEEQAQAEAELLKRKNDLLEGIKVSKSEIREIDANLERLASARTNPHPQLDFPC